MSLCEPIKSYHWNWGLLFRTIAYVLTTMGISSNQSYLNKIMLPPAFEIVYILRLR